MSLTHDENLQKAAYRALKWNYLGALVRAGSTIIVNAVLARLLGPEPFGLAAVAWMFTGIGYILADLGFGAALVQKKQVTAEDIRYTASMQVLVGLGMAAVNWLLAGLIARLFHNPAAAPVVRIVSLLFIIQALGQTASSLLKREMDFKSLQMAQVFSYMAAFIGVGIPLAFLGAGVWALITAQLMQAFLNTVLVYVKVRHPLRPLFRAKDKAVIGYGLKVVGTNIVNWVIVNVDNLIVGRAFGVVPLGLYSRAYQLVTVPMNNIVTVLQNVLFPAYSRAQDDDQLLKRVYLGSIGAVALVVTPIFFTVAAVPSTVIEALYGARWLSASSIITPLALAMPVHAVMALAGPVIWGKGMVEKEFRVQSFVALLFVVALGLASRGSLVLLAWAVLLVYSMRLVLMTLATVRVLRIKGAELIPTLRGSIAVTLICALITWGLDTAIGTGISVWVRLLADVGVAAVTAIALIWFFPRFMLPPEVADLVVKAVTRVYAPLGDRLLGRVRR